MKKYRTYEAWHLDREPGPHAVDTDCDGDWVDKWAPSCPNRKSQRLLEIAGFRLKGPDYLQLRVIVRDEDEGGCHLIVDQRTDRLHVRAMAHRDAHTRRRRRLPTEEMDCPSNYWLDEPLGERVVIDVDTGVELPFFIPRWDEDLPSLYVPRPSGDLWALECSDIATDPSGSGGLSANGGSKEIRLA